MVVLTVERPLVGDIVHEQNAHGATVVCRGNCPEALLASGIPDLELDTLTIKLDRPNLEVDTNGGDERGGEGVLTEPQQTARLADARVTNQEELDLKKRDRLLAMKTQLRICE